MRELIPHLSIKPVLNSQVRHLYEIGGVSSEQCGIVLETDACDLEIHGANAQSFPAERAEAPGSFEVPRQQNECRKEVNALSQLCVCESFFLRLTCFRNARQPTTLDFLCADNGGGDLRL